MSPNHADWGERSGALCRQLVGRGGICRLPPHLGPARAEVYGAGCHNTGKHIQTAYTHTHRIHAHTRARTHTRALTQPSQDKGRAGHRIHTHRTHMHTRAHKHARADIHCTHSRVDADVGKQRQDRSRIPQRLALLISPLPPSVCFNSPAVDKHSHVRHILINAVKRQFFMSTT